MLSRCFTTKSLLLIILGMQGLWCTGNFMSAADHSERKVIINKSTCTCIKCSNLWLTNVHPFTGVEHSIVQALIAALPIYSDNKTLNSPLVQLVHEYVGDDYGPLWLQMQSIKGSSLQLWKSGNELYLLQYAASVYGYKDIRLTGADVQFDPAAISSLKNVLNEATSASASMISSCGRYVVKAEARRRNPYYADYTVKLWHGIAIGERLSQLISQSQQGSCTIS